VRRVFWPSERRALGAFTAWLLPHPTNFAGSRTAPRLQAGLLTLRVADSPVDGPGPGGTLRLPWHASWMAMCAPRLRNSTSIALTRPLAVLEELSASEAGPLGSRPRRRG